MITQYAMRKISEIKKNEFLAIYKVFVDQQSVSNIGINNNTV